MAKAAEKVIDIWKKKRWHKILAPKLFNEMVIGETPALEPNSLVGRTLKINMMTLVGDIKKQHIDVTFEIEKVMGETAYSDIKKFEMNASTIRRYIRRGRIRVDDSFACLTADNKRIKIKPFMITFSKTTNSVVTMLRKRAREVLVRAIKGMSYDTLCRELVTFSLQKSLRDMLNKIYPLRVCEIRVMEICKGEAVKAGEPTEEKTLAGEKKEEAEKEEEKAEKVEESTEEKKITKEHIKESGKKEAEEKAEKKEKKQKKEKEEAKKEE